MSIAINRDEWLKALSDAGMDEDGPDDQGAVTIHEFAAMFDIHPTVAGARLRRLEARGKARRVRKRVENSYGRRVSYVAYRLT